MHLTHLSLTTFRSYESLDLTFDDERKTTVLIGNNASGKTNVLEAISTLGLLQSLRNAEENDLIRWEKEFYRVRGTCRSDQGEERSLEVVSQVQPRKQRASFVNDVRIPRQRYIGTLPIILFTPDDLTLFTGAPGNRRTLIDTLLHQVSPTYAQALSEYKKVLKQRNTLLKSIREGTQSASALDVWDEKIASLGALVTVERLQLFEELTQSITRTMNVLGEKVDTAHFVYVRKTEDVKEGSICTAILDYLTRNRERDCIIGTTTIGPHRDDWILQMNHRDISTFASRGQQRTAILALILLQATFLENRKGEKPLLLLDDVFSELDIHHRTALLDTLSGNQVFITTVELDETLQHNATVVGCPIDN